MLAREKSGVGVYQYKYNGKEWQDELGLNLYDYGARNYDPALGRFFVLDLFSEQFVDRNPYHYVSNNPVNKVDVGGHLEIIVNDQKNYKKAINAINSALKEIHSNPVIMKGLQKYGNFSEQDVKELISTAGSGIKVNFIDTADNTYGWFESYDNNIYIEIALLDQINSSSTSEEAKQLGIYALLQLILHEAVHYGDNNLKSGRTQGNGFKEMFYSNSQKQPIGSVEIGEAFEIRTFWGGDIDAFNAFKNSADKTKENGYRHGKTGRNNMRNLTKSKIDKNKTNQLPQGMQDFIKKIQEERPDLDIFIYE